MYCAVVCHSRLGLLLKLHTQHTHGAISTLCGLFALCVDPKVALPGVHSTQDEVTDEGTLGINIRGIMTP